jgi:hypothetical protein
VVFIGKCNLGRVPLPEFTSLIAIFSQEEVLKSRKTTNSIRHFQAIDSKDVFGESNNPNLIITTTLTMRRTGDHKFEEVDKKATPKACIRNISSVGSKKLFSHLQEDNNDYSKVS